jgi:hypothetical protein
MLSPTRAVEWAYPTKDGAVVVTVRHDQMREDLRVDDVRDLCSSSEPTKCVRCWRPIPDKAVKAMLLKHEWDKKDTQFAKVVAADIRSWTLEQLSEAEFVLRRTVRK